ncbi:MAG: hypothetical protein JKY48_04840 [Flavobacteriales bacterium]|nr:hypothetical protein [Flavobacteriales bacterium]
MFKFVRYKDTWWLALVFIISLVAVQTNAVKNLYDFAELVSLFLTIPTISISTVVIFLFTPAAILALTKEEKEYSDWLALGIWVGFIGGAWDNAWWGGAWTHYYLDKSSEWTTFFFDNGVINNIPARQGADILAGYCHIRGVHSKSKEFSVKTWKFGCYGGAAFISFLMIVRL